jgi:hypothetical protein
MTVLAAVVQPGQFYTPPSVPSKGSILDIADIQTGNLPWVATGLVESYNCIGVDVDALACAGFKGLTKRFDAPSYGDGSMFNVQAGVTCKGPGFDMNDPALRSAFEAVEPEGVSIGLHDTILVNGTDLTPAAGSVTPAQALGLLEAAGNTGYSGQAVIHAGPMLASLWASSQTVIKVGNHLETHLGTPVAVSTGNESKTAGKLDTDQWAFVTGSVALWRSEAVQASAIDRVTNDQTTLYERLYVAAIDCFKAKVKVKVL